MTETCVFALGSVVLVSAVSLIGVLTLSLRQNFLHNTLFLLVSLSAGALFGDALIHLIPESVDTLGNSTTTALVVLGGILIFFAVEKFLHWRHTHSGAEVELKEGSDPQHTHIKPVGHLVIVADGVHNLIDGVIIGASYLVGIEIGIATTVAIILHEIPQEIGDFAVLLHAGFSTTKALLVNFLSALASVLGVLGALLIGSVEEKFLGTMIALGAGGFLYIAGSDLIPEIHKTTNMKKSLLQFGAIIVGIGFMMLLLFVE